MNFKVINLNGGVDCPEDEKIELTAANGRKTVLIGSDPVINSLFEDLHKKQYDLDMSLPVKVGTKVQIISDTSKIIAYLLGEKLEDTLGKAIKRANGIAGEEGVISNGLMLTNVKEDEELYYIIDLDTGGFEFLPAYLFKVL